MPNITISFTEREFEELQMKATNGSIPQYIKTVVLSDSEFNKRFEELKSKVNNIPSGTKFSIKLVFGTDWLSIEKGIKLALGRHFYNSVKSGQILGVDILEKDPSNTQFYGKI